MIRPRARHEFQVRRIVVAAESSAHGRTAVTAAVALAHRLEAELEGLFIQDVNLMRLAGLPVARLVRIRGGKPEGGAASEIATELDAESRQIRRALESEAARAGVKASFRVTQGRLDAEFVSAGGLGDLLIVSHAGRGAGPAPAVLAAMAGSARSVLVLRDKPLAAIRHALVLYDGSPGGDKALLGAMLLVGESAEGLTVALRAANPEAARRLRRRVETQARHHGAQVRFRTVAAPSLNELCRLAGAIKADLTVIAADDALLADNGNRKLLEDMACPVLLVR